MRRPVCPERLEVEYCSGLWILAVLDLDALTLSREEAFILERDREYFLTGHFVSLLISLALAGLVLLILNHSGYP